MDFVPYAVPFFIALIVVELLVDRWRGARNYRMADAINSLSTGVLSTTTGLLTKGVGLLTYAFALKHLALIELSAESVWTWVFAFVFYDFCYYWLHRCGHERNILWAAHSVHHQSEDYNLTTALRQTSTGFLLSWIFYLPLAVLGVPLVVFISVASLNLLYQFWVHTRHVPKLAGSSGSSSPRPIIGPTMHRTLSTWIATTAGCSLLGRLFGSFQEEDENEPVIFGVTTPWPVGTRCGPTCSSMRSCGVTRGARKAVGTSCASGSCVPAGGRDVKANYPLTKPDLSQFRKFEVPLDTRQQVYVALQFAVYVGFGSYLMNIGEGLPTAALVLGWSAMALGLFSLGVALENRPWALKAELVRLGLNVPLVWLARWSGFGRPCHLGWPGLLSYSLLSLIGLYCCRGRLTRLAS